VTRTRPGLNPNLHPKPPQTHASREQWPGSFVDEFKASASNPKSPTRGNSCPGTLWSLTPSGHLAPPPHWAHAVTPPRH
jgi:hypothetical protein